MLSTARDLGADALATGHYARRVMGGQGAEMHRASDDTRDQSYFLFTTTREQLDYLRFPLGEMSKAETRALAERFNLPVADKPDSQDICFVPNGDYASVVSKLRPGAIDGGDIVDMSGVVLGRHEGIINFTVGQRRGLNLSTREGENNEPLYVVCIDAVKRQVVVGPKEALAQAQIRLREINWLGGDVPDEGLEISVKLRSAQAPLPGRFYRKGADASVTLSQPAFSVAPGQAGVVYQGERLLGGGWITST
jgi:tRNA-specific 2-thiouridylase